MRRQVFVRMTPENRHHIDRAIEASETRISEFAEQALVAALRKKRPPSDPYAYRPGNATQPGEGERPRVCLRLPDELVRKLDDRADAWDMDRSPFIRGALKDHADAILRDVN